MTTIAIGQPVAQELCRPALFGLAAVLLDYPDAELHAAAPDLAAATGDLGDPTVSALLVEFLDWFAGASLLEVQKHYVRTFDLRRRSGLYLTYYLHGDTRKRGIALLTLKQRYRAHGLVLDDGELPDLLPIVLEFAATAGPGAGEAPLRQHRRGLELLRAALEEARSPYRLLLEAVTRVLPTLTDADREALAALAADGPPVETVGIDELDGVGLAPYAPCPSEARP